MSGWAAGFVPGRAAGLVPGVDALFAEVLRISRGYPVFTTDYYILDPLTPGGGVLAFVDWNDPTHLLLQTTQGLQVRAPALDPKYHGKGSVTFSAHRYISTRAASAWNFLHYGPCTVWTTCDFASISSAGRIWETGGGANPDATDFIRNTSIMQWHLIRGSTATTTQRSGLTTNTPYAFEAVLDTTLNPAMVLRTSGQATVTTASVGGTPASLAGTTFRWGVTAAGTFAFTGTTRHLFMSTPSVSAAELATVRAYLYADSRLVVA